MAAYATLTVNAEDIIGADFDPSRASVWIEANTPHSAIVVDGQTVRVGGRSEKFVDGVATFELVTTNSADNPASFSYRGGITYIEKGSRNQGRKTLSISDFPFTAAANLAAIEEAWDGIAADPIWRSDFRLEMEAVAETAAASATSAAASAATAKAVSDADTADDLIVALDADESSAFRVQQDSRYDAKYGRGKSVAAFGAVGDGVADDTSAIQAAIDAAEPGEQIYFPQTGSGQFYKITDTLRITTPSLRLIGQPRDAYAMSIRCTVPGKVMIEVKTAGFVMKDISLWGDANLNQGLGATVIGLDLYGTTNGDVDSIADGCTLQNLALGVRVRGRNATVERSLFSHCLSAVQLTGKDAVYHTGPAADQNRGNLIRGNRFHDIGATQADATIDITDTAKVLHAVIQDNHFDSNGNARHIVALGTSTNPHAKLTILNNKHTEMRSTGVELTYVNNATIRGAYLSGGTNPADNFNGINLNNCDTTLVSDCFGLQLGQHGIYARNCTKLRVFDTAFRAGGICTANVGDGFNIDLTNTLCTFDGISVEGTDGYGFRGSPTLSRLGDYDFLSCTLGQFSSTVFSPEVVHLGAANMIGITGSPNLTGVPGFGYLPSWQMDATTAEQVSALAELIPQHWRSFDLVLWWAPSNAGAGNVVWGTNYSWITPNATPSSDATSAGNDTGAAPGITGQIVETVLASAITPKRAPLQVRVSRVAADAGDTYTGDAGIVAVRLVRTA